jgi:muramoyltetrapeptide carboxypeptidase
LHILTNSTFGIAIAATGGYAPDYPAVEAGIARLRQQGYLIHNYYHHDERYQRFAGTDEARLAQLYAAAEDPEIEVVLALRGSYGMSGCCRILISSVWLTVASCSSAIAISRPSRWPI